LALAGSVAVVAAPAAQAQRIIPGPNTMDGGCYLAQTDYVDGVAEFKAAYAAGNRVAMDAAGVKLRRGEDFWKTNCEGIYGSLYISRQAPTGDKGALSPDASAPKSGATATQHPGSNTMAP
jgi:hypothetical protein